MPKRTDNYRKLAIHLTMDFSVIVLFMFDRRTRQIACVWSGGPSEETMQAPAVSYHARFQECDLRNAFWIQSDELFQKLNRPAWERPDTWADSILKHNNRLSDQGG